MSSLFLFKKALKTQSFQGFFGVYAEGIAIFATKILKNIKYEYYSIYQKVVEKT
jgi:hypothetical protein